MNMIRTVLVIVFLFLGAVFAFSANATVWANRTVFDTDNFVSTVNRTLDEEQVQEQLATRLSTTLIEEGQVRQRLREELPEGLQFLAPILTVTARNLAHEIILRLLQNEQVRDGLDTALRLLHQQVLRIIEGEGAVVFEENKIILDMGAVLRQAADELNVDGQGLLSNLNLPDDAGQIVLVEDAETASAVQDLLSLHDQITWLVIVLSVVCFALAVLIGRDRRTTLRTVGIVLVVSGLLAITTLVPLRPIVADLAQNPDAARAAVDAIVLDYRIQSFFLVFLGAAIILIAVLLGQSELARAVRGAVRRDPGAPAPDMGTAIRNSATPLRVVGLVAGALFLAALPNPSDRTYVTTLALMALYFVGLWIITSDSGWAGQAREWVSSAWGRVAPTADEQRNPTFAGRHANQLRIAGVVLAIVAAILIPNLGVGAVAGIIALTFVYLALVDWLATRAE